MLSFLLDVFVRFASWICESVIRAAGLVVGSDTDTFTQDIQLPKSLRRESHRAYTLQRSIVLIFSLHL